MKNLLTLACAFALTLCVTNFAQADSWYGQRSKFSHSNSRSYPTGMNRFARGTYRTAPRGGYVKSGYRQINSHIYVRGHSTDYYNVRESWFQYGEEF